MRHLEVYVRSTMKILVADIKVKFEVLLKCESEIILAALDRLIEFYEPEVDHIHQLSDYVHSVEIQALEAQLDKAIESLNQVVENEHQKNLI